VDVEDPARAGDDLDRLELGLPLLENARRQTGGVRERASGDAVFDAHAVTAGHTRRIVSGDRSGPVRFASGL